MVTRSYIDSMGQNRSVESLRAFLGAFRPERYTVTRSLALYAAAIALADVETLATTQQVCQDYRATDRQMYEVMLQSYLFLGFPRMLIAAEQLTKAGVTPDRETEDYRVSDSDVREWMERGARLCRRVYDGNYGALRNRVEAMAPEIFLWMELEGYGKVLSRPGLDIVDRELAIVACLMVEDRPIQLHSHVRGAINVGTPPEMLRDVVSDLGSIAPEGFRSVCEIMQKLGLRG